jgi:signal transduction histidine kinase
MKIVNKKILLLSALLFYSFVLYAQNNTLDSLIKVLQTQKEDTNKVNTLNKLSEALAVFIFLRDSGIYKPALDYAETAFSLAEKINFKKGKAIAYQNFAIIFLYQKDFTKALKNFLIAIKIFEEIGDKFWIVHLHHAIGESYERQGNYAEALKNLSIALKMSIEIGQKNEAGFLYYRIASVSCRQSNYGEAIKNNYAALRIFEELGNKWMVSLCIQCIGESNYLLGNNSEALNNWIACLKIREEINYKGGLGQTYNSIGLVYLEQGKYVEALQNFFSALKNFEEIRGFDGSWGIPMSYTAIGRVYEKQGDVSFAASEKRIAKKKYYEALENYHTALKGWKRYKDKSRIAECYIHIANGNIKLKRISIAKDYLQKALSLSLEFKNKVNIEESYLSFSNLNSLQHNYKAAYEHYKKYILYRDSIVNEENTRKSLLSKIQYEFDKKEAVAKEEQDKKNAIAKAEQAKKDVVIKAEMERQRIIRNFSFTLVLLILAFSGYGFYRYKKRKQLQNQQSLMKERLRISRELHDEVGATLSGIAMYSQLTKEQIKHADSSEVEKSLNIMQQNAGEMVNKLNDIVWLINPDKDTLQKLVQRLDEYATDMAMIKNMQVKVNVPTHLAEHSLPMESRRNIYLFCKEAINNAVKYSNGTLLQLTIKEANNTLEFSVSDNGKGFDAVMVRRGNGLDNMQKRADEIGAKLMLQSKKDEGCLVSMQFKIT